MTRVFPVTFSVAVDLISLELLPTFTSTGPGSITKSPDSPVYPSTLIGTANLTVFDSPGSRSIRANPMSCCAGSVTPVAVSAA
jgi:hypothetical protein